MTAEGREDHAPDEPGHWVGVARTDDGGGRVGDHDVTDRLPQWWPPPGPTAPRPAPARPRRRPPSRETEGGARRWDCTAWSPAAPRRRRRWRPRASTAPGLPSRDCLDTTPTTGNGRVGPTRHPARSATRSSAAQSHPRAGRASLARPHRHALTSSRRRSDRHCWMLDLTMTPYGKHCTVRRRRLNPGEPRRRLATANDRQV